FWGNVLEIKKLSSAGTLESSDILIKIEKSEKDGIHIHLDSPVKQQFGDQIKKVITESAEIVGVKKACVTAIDKGALDCVIKARALTAFYRACESDDYNWELNNER
ncbi:MAG: citrate lyase acyl carrier protein, partial [Pleomorphochaeta sp.]